MVYCRRADAGLASVASATTETDVTTNNPPPGQPYEPGQPYQPWQPYQPGQPYEGYPPQYQGPPPGFDPQQPYGTQQPYGQPDPYGPQGPGHPAPGYSPQPGYPPQSGYPQFPVYGGQPGYAPRPSSATAIIAAVLAFLGALAATVGAISDAVALGTLSDSDNHPAWLSGYATAEGLVAVIRLGVLLAGGVLLLKRRPVGRVLILVGCALTFLMAIVAYSVVTSRLPDDVPGSVGTGVGATLALAFPIATVVLLLVPPTTRWLRSA